MSLVADSEFLRARSYDVVVIGAGVAGLAFTLRLPPRLRVALLTKGVLGESNTRYAQGGLAAAVGADDSPDLHLADTLAAGAGLSDPDAVRTLVDGAPAAVAWLIALGTGFDAAQNGQPLLGREAAHSRRRVLHAGGDATGAEIERALVAGVRADLAVDVFADAFVLDLLRRDDRCAGVLAQLASDAPPVRIEAAATVLAAGGAGQLWATTSNPLGATADGLGMALRAGVAVADLEFVQFHPTVLAMPGSTPFLVTEAIRGEGAFLRGASGDRFMEDLHPLAELAPRDVVARGIQRQMALDDRPAVSLDLQHLQPDEVRRRFPTIQAELASRGLDLATDLIPVAPAAHYFGGGIIAGADGRTSLPGLTALGEVTCTGVHGANRLASNSLLEGLVFGMAAAERIGRDSPTGTPTGPSEPPRVGVPVFSDRSSIPAEESVKLRRSLQQVMSRDVAVVRDAAGLNAATMKLEEISQVLATGALDRRDLWELRNMTDAALAIVAAALHRQESRGAHFRLDFLEPNPTLAGCHSLLAPAGISKEWRYGLLNEALPAEPSVPHPPSFH